MDIGSMSFNELVENYNDFLQQLTGKEVTKIAANLEKNPKTIYNYLSKDYFIGKPNNNLILMREIVKNGLQILSDRGVIYS